MRFLTSILLLFFFNLNIFAQSDSVQIVPVQAVNSTFQDYAPIFLDTATMIFTSSRPNPLAERNMSNNFNMYLSHKQDSTWSSPVFLTYLSNSDNHEASAGISSDLKTVFIYKTFNGGDIYISEVKNQKLSSPKRASFNSQWNESSAYVSNNILYFVSDKPGGKGEHDIYYCTAIDKGWSEPINLTVLNSEKDENYISLSPKGDTINFSSTGHYSKGGYDIFRSIRQSDGQWSAPININPINTTYDEICFTTDPSGKKYFSSNRPDEKNKGYNIYLCIEPIKKIIEPEVFKIDIPIEIEADIAIDTNSTNIVKIDADPADQSLEEIKAQIDFKISYCEVQVGAFSSIKSISEFAKQFPLIGEKVFMIKSKNYIRYIMNQTFESIDSAAVLQKKCLKEYHSVHDTFIGVYDDYGHRVVICFDVAKNKYLILKPTK